MVGVPGRSKACHNCRRRKKGCDRNLPSCHQCIRHGLVCEGYDRELIWINASGQDEEPDKSAIPSRPDNHRQHKAPWLSMYSKVVGNANAKVAMADSLALTAREQKYLGIFWNDYLPDGRAFSDQACMLSTGSWTRAVNRLHGSEPILDKAMMALSASVLGAQNNDAQLKLKGLQTYCSATVDMMNAVRHGRHSRSDGVLAAVRLLEFYEVLFGFGAELDATTSNMLSWWRHNDGQLALILLRGPATFQHGPAHTLFVDARYNIALSHITRRRRCPLQHPNWTSIPWKLCKKSVKDKLVDILVHLPGLMEDDDNLRTATSSALAREQRQTTIASVLAMKKALLKWEIEMGLELERFDYTVSPMPLKPPSNGREVSLLHLSNLYWSISLAVDSTLGELYKQNGASGLADTEPEGDSETETSLPTPTSVGDEPNSATSPKDTPTGIEVLRMHAYKIAHSIQLLLGPESGAFGCNVSLFPLLSTWRFLAMTEPADEPSPERQMIEKLFGKEFQGTRIGRYAASLQRHVWESQQARQARFA